MSFALATVCNAIQSSGGWLPFSRYMEIVLHHPQVGFYGSGRVNFGANGDFVTASSLSPLFAITLTRQIDQIMQFSRANILELGAGDGKLAYDIINELTRARIQHQYMILETSAALRHRQQQTLAKINNVQWINSLPQTFSGCILANEVLDAAPFDIIARRDNKWHQRGVTYSPSILPPARAVIEADYKLQWQERPLNAAHYQKLNSLNLPNGYITEISPQADALVKTLCQTLHAGALLIFDYGFGDSEYYHPQRDSGTLMCHCRQQADADPLQHPGDKDITAHINFTAIAEAGLDGGASLAGYTTQAHFLINSGIANLLEKAAKSQSPLQYAKLAAGANKLLAPHEMGELFKCIALCKKNMPPLIGFSNGDRQRQL